MKLLKSTRRDNNNNLVIDENEQLIMNEFVFVINSSQIDDWTLAF